MPAHWLGALVEVAKSVGFALDVGDLLALCRASHAKLQKNHINGGPVKQGDKSAKLARRAQLQHNRATL